MRCPWRSRLVRGCRACREAMDNSSSSSSRRRPAGILDQAQDQDLPPARAVHPLVDRVRITRRTRTGRRHLRTRTRTRMGTHKNEAMRLVRRTYSTGRGRGPRLDRTRTDKDGYNRVGTHLNIRSNRRHKDRDNRNIDQAHPTRSAVPAPAPAPAVRLRVPVQVLRAVARQKADTRRVQARERYLTLLALAPLRRRLRPQDKGSDTTPAARGVRHLHCSLRTKAKAKAQFRGSTRQFLTPIRPPHKRSKLNRDKREAEDRGIHHCSSIRLNFMSLRIRRRLRKRRRLSWGSRVRVRDRDRDRGWERGRVRGGEGGGRGRR